MPFKGVGRTSQSANAVSLRRPVISSSAWRQLRVEHKELLGHLSRLAGVENGRQPLLVGPLAGAEQAQSLCGNLERRGQRCRALPL